MGLCGVVALQVLGGQAWLSVTTIGSDQLVHTSYWLYRVCTVAKENLLYYQMFKFKGGNPLLRVGKPIPKGGGDNEIIFAVALSEMCEIQENFQP